MTNEHRADEAGHEYQRSNVTRLVKQLRNDILASPTDTFLGVEDDLLQRYATSRPTLRQAMRVLEHERLVAVKRGWAGGYYTRRPDDRDAVEAAALNLQLHGCDMSQAMEVARALARAMSRSASQSTDEAARAAVRALVDEYETAGYPNRPLADFMEAERRLSAAIAKLARNPALTFFSAVIQEFGISRAGVSTFKDRPDRIEARVLANARTIRAVLDGDAAIVDVLHARAEAMVSQWMAEDAAAQAPPRASRRQRVGSPPARLRPRRS